MRLTDYFIPTLRESPKEAQIPSHSFMLRAGLIKQSSAGIYSWLPLGLKVLKNIEEIVRLEMNRTGSQEILMPTIQPAEIWRESGRYEDYGKEMLRIVDRHDREMLYGPTNEEMITDLFRSTIRSYRDLPKNLYHQQWKFRDEVRPRFGVMRGKEFLMKDAYSFDLDREGAIRSYNQMFVAYLRIFNQMGLKAIPMKAETGPIGGDLSHEFLVLADTGESEVFYHKDILNFKVPNDEIDYSSELQTIVDEWTSLYAATSEKADQNVHTELNDSLMSARGIEVGHIFYFGTKYSKAMSASVADSNGNLRYLEMGSYGIGVSRLVGAIIEASHDDKGIIWPESIAPFKVGIINLRKDDGLCVKESDLLYSAIGDAGLSVLYDDRDESGGAKFANMDLIGLPWQVIVGPRGLKEGQVEIKNRATNQKQSVPLGEVLNVLSGR
ncbi:MAG: proline--tRNA ligase [Rhodospirillaceae bacterium]|nr:proline--tRNA ligase [Rhodospirillaceae bacterium]OUT79993.1 MAG: proline--tRNA ligase [Rhodospirillaceae bacterium TMED23]